MGFDPMRSYPIYGLHAYIWVACMSRPAGYTFVPWIPLSDAPLNLVILVQNQ
jgi:hypothetical protein